MHQNITLMPALMAQDDLSPPLSPEDTARGFGSSDATPITGSSVSGEPSATLWSRVEPVIRTMYIEEDKCLPLVAQIMEDNYGFKAS